MKTFSQLLLLGSLVVVLFFAVGKINIVNFGNRLLSGVLGSSSNQFTITPSSLSLEVTGDNAKFNNTADVSFPYIPGQTEWPAWYITNTAAWNKIYYHYGKTLPNGWGPGKLQWTTDLTGYAPGVYTDTITLTSEKYGSVNFINTVKVLSAGDSSTAPSPVVTPTPDTTNTTPTTPVATPTTPVASFTVSCVYLTCSLDASASTSSGSSITSYKWDLGKSPGGTESGKQISTTYPHEGNRTVSLTVTNSGGSKNTVSKTFTVTAPAAATPPVVTTPVPSTKFSIGNTVQTTSSLNVRATGSATGTLLGTQASGAQGTVVAGPTSSGGYSWWQINYASGVDGWSAEDFLVVYVAPAEPVVTPPVVTPPIQQVPAPVIGTLPPHPRVWMNSERLARVRAQATANTTRWQKVKALADAQVAKATATSADGYTLPDLCLAYLGSGDARYATRAGAVLSAYAVESNNLTYDSGYGTRFWLPVVSMGLDWCYNGLTVAQRQQAATWLMNRADWVWPQSNPARSIGWAVNDEANNYWWGFMMTGPAALAASGDDTGVGTISGNNRPAYHMQLALTKWTNQALPFFQNEGAGGAWAEGTNYESTWRVGSFADAFLTSGTQLDNTFLAQSALWRLHSTMPGNVYKVPFGDQPRVSDASIFTYDRMHALYALPFAGNLVDEMYGWLSRVGQVPYSEFNETAVLADELLRFDPAQASSTPTLPLSYLAPGPGFFLYRQSWTDPNTTVMAFESGPASGHGARDANGLMIWKGPFWISANANIYSQSGIEGQTRNYNNMTISGGTYPLGPGGINQYLYRGNGGRITGTQVTSSLVAIRAQAKNAYGYEDAPWTFIRPVTDYRRTVAYLPQQDVFVIVDQTSLRDATMNKTWHWQSKDVPTVSGNTFQLKTSPSPYSCFGSVPIPSNVTLGTEVFNLGPSGAQTSNGVTVTMPARQNEVVVTILQCTSASSAPYNATATLSATAVNANIGSTQVTIPLDETQPVTVR